MENRELNLADLLGIALKRIWVIIAAMIIGGLAALYFSRPNKRLKRPGFLVFLSDTFFILSLLTLFKNGINYSIRLFGG